MARIVDVEKKGLDENSGAPLDTATSYAQGTQRHLSAVEHDDVFGEITAEGPNYRSVSWHEGAVAMSRLI